MPHLVTSIGFLSPCPVVVTWGVVVANESGDFPNGECLSLASLDLHCLEMRPTLSQWKS